MSSPLSARAAWPSLPLEAWKNTADTLHLWTQIVGKVRLARSPLINHWWQVPLYVTARGLTTSPIPAGTRTFEISFDFIDHRLHIDTSDGAARTMALAPRTVAEFYREIMASLEELGLKTTISAMPNEIADATPFDRDDVHASYDAGHAHRFWQILVQVDRVFTRFRSRFVGKVSPVHFFWGSFDLAVSRFSGRPAPPHPGSAPNFGNRAMREAYSHEVSSCGFWPGGGAITEPAFYSYIYPEPPGFSDASVRPPAAFYSRDLREFVLPYESVRTAEQPDETLLSFLQSTYDAAADLARWDRQALERPEDVPARH
ncbi:MAG: DUF5996 family protein [Gemmatimonadaceae bacterium]